MLSIRFIKEVLGVLHIPYKSVHNLQTYRWIEKKRVETKSNHRKRGNTLMTQQML